MKLEHVLGAAGVVMMMTVAGCASSSPEDSKSSEAAITMVDETGDDAPIPLAVDDLDGDGEGEVWYTRPSLCGTGGCTYSVHLSTRPDETFGEVFGFSFRARGPRMDPNAPPDSFYGDSKGGYCSAFIGYYKFNEETQTYEKNSSTDCSEVIHREDGRVADGEYRCLELTPISECNHEK